MSRDDLYAALYARLLALKTSGTVRVCDRRPRFLDQMAASELPALFLAADHQQVIRPANGPARYQLGARLFVYAAAPDRHSSAATPLNSLIDAVEAVLKPAPGETRQTLNGRVLDVLINGRIEIYEAPLAERAAAIIPITMLISQ